MLSLRLNRAVLSLPDSGQSRGVNLCIEIGHLCICCTSRYFENRAMQDLSMPDILVAKNNLKMLVKLYFGLPVPQIQGHCLVKSLPIKPIPFPLYLIIVPQGSTEASSIKALQVFHRVLHET